MKRRDFLKASACLVIAPAVLVEKQKLIQQNIVLPLHYNKIIMNVENTIGAKVGDIVLWSYKNLACDSIKIETCRNNDIKKYQAHGVVKSVREQYCDIQIHGHVKVQCIS